VRRSRWGTPLRCSPALPPWWGGVGGARERSPHVWGARRAIPARGSPRVWGGVGGARERSPPRWGGVGGARERSPPRWGGVGGAWQRSPRRWGAHGAMPARGSPPRWGGVGGAPERSPPRWGGRRNRAGAFPTSRRSAPAARRPRSAAKIARSAPGLQFSVNLGLGGACSTATVSRERKRAGASGPSRDLVIKASLRTMAPFDVMGAGTPMRRGLVTPRRPAPARWRSRLTHGAWIVR
jgi:hypothetical protein